MIIDGSGVIGTAASIAGAIRRAAAATGASFDYLLAAAKVESNLDPEARARRSSATGLFQFIEQTWLAMLKSAGPAFGYGRYAEAIVQTPAGDYAVADPVLRTKVMELRRDPAASAAMAAAFTRQNDAELRERLGRAPTAGELYMAHFLGAAGAARLIARAADAPQTPAAELFPAAAAANPGIFYDRHGRPRSAGDVYARLAGRLEAARAAVALTPAQAAPPAAAAEPSAPDTAGTVATYALVSAVPVAPRADTAPAFHGLFQTGGHRQPISPIVAAFWGGAPAAEQPPAPRSDAS